MKIKTAILLTLLLIPAALGADYLRKAATDYAFPVILVDATDGYTSETEKKAADTTVTYGNITDANSMSAYTDDDTVWKEMGNGTGEYRLIIGASEFSTADKDYLVKIVVSGCRTARFIVHTTVGAIGNIATTDDGGPINVDSGLAQAVLKSVDGNDLTAACWNTTTKMFNVDVNYVRESDPLYISGEDDLIKGIRTQWWEAADDGDPNNDSPADRTYSGLAAISAALGTPVGATFGADVASIIADVNSVDDWVWLRSTRTLTALDEDDTTIDLDGTSVNATATISESVKGEIADAVWDELVTDHTTRWSAGWVMKALMGQ